MYSEAQKPSWHSGIPIRKDFTYTFLPQKRVTRFFAAKMIYALRPESFVRWSLPSGKFRLFGLWCIYGYNSIYGLLLSIELYLSPLQSKATFISEFYISTLASAFMSTDTFSSTTFEYLLAIPLSSKVFHKHCCNHSTRYCTHSNTHKVKVTHYMVISSKSFGMVFWE